MTSSGTVLSFFRPRQSVERDWTQCELAEFYRVEAALIRAGLLVDVDRGISDEGDPWFVFCRRDNGEVIAHFARIGDQYAIASSAFPGLARGKDFAQLVGELTRSYPTALPRATRQSQNVFLHPAAMLVALVATAFIVSDHDAQDQHSPTSLGKESVRLLSLGELAVLSAVAIATTWVEHQIDSILKTFETGHVLHQDESGTKSAAQGSENSGGVLDAIWKLGLHFDAHTFPNEGLSASTILAASAESHDGQVIATPPAILNDPHSVAHASPLEGLDAIAPLSMPTFSNSVDGGTHSPWSSAIQLDVQPYFPTVSIQPYSVAAAPTSAHSALPASDQVSSAASLVSAPITSMEAYHVLGATPPSGTNAPVILSGADSPLQDSIHQVLTHFQLPVSNQPSQSPQPGTDSSLPAMPSGTIPLSTELASALAHSASSPLPFDSSASVTLHDFKSTTQNLETDVVGQHIILVDKNGADVANSHYGSQTWAFDDGSTLTIIGIIPSSAHAAAISYK